MKKKNKLTVKEKVAIAVFMNSAPRLIDLWRKTQTELSFDLWLLEQIEKNKGVQK